MNVPPDFRRQEAVGQQVFRSLFIDVYFIEQAQGQVCLHGPAVFIGHPYFQCPFFSFPIAFLVRFHFHIQPSLRMHVHQTFRHGTACFIVESKLRNALLGKCFHRHTHPHTSMQGGCSRTAGHAPHASHQPHRLWRIVLWLCQLEVKKPFRLFVQLERQTGSFYRAERELTSVG